MKKWSNPEMMELNLSDTEGFARNGDKEDGYWNSIDNTWGFVTYSGPCGTA